MGFDVVAFQQKVWQHDRQKRRDFPWRQTTDPYRILVSEVMLQQTQTTRVVPFYERFIARLPAVADLATVDVATLLKLWQGLGYNRRALYLRRTAQQIQVKYEGKIPASQTELSTLPGIGPNTAGAILAYAFNQPVVFLETNIRKVFIDHFFAGQPKVSDREIWPLVETTLDRAKPREWYWALVDYGHHLGRTKRVANSRSWHYVKQSAFIGSKRQLRATVLRLIVDGPQRLRELSRLTNRSAEELTNVLTELVHEGFLMEKHDTYAIATPGKVRT